MKESRADKIIELYGTNESFIDVAKANTSPFKIADAQLGMELVFKVGDEYEGNVVILKSYEEDRGIVVVNMGSAHLHDIDPNRLLLLAK